jgi:molybdate/tungstate transport system ATP-binding protein
MININNLDVSYDTFSLRNINLEIDKNDFFVLMGPTGAGKTVLLESIAGLTPVKSGSIILNGRDITKLPPEKRGIGIVYQDYALFPHMNIRDNITYGFRYHSSDKNLMQKRLLKLCSQLNIEHLLDRYPGTLSGGELQRSALARAIMFEPEVLMLDEPLSALDPCFRREIQDLLRELHRSTDITFLMVTHDFSEALSLAGKAAVMNNGQIEQVDDVDHLFRKPATEFVAEFVGMKNILHTLFREGKAVSEDIEVTLGLRPADNRSEGYIAVRPEDIVISPAPLTSSMQNSFKGTVALLIDRGFVFEVIIDCGKHQFTSLVTKGSITNLDLKPGTRVCFSFKATAIHIF